MLGLSHTQVPLQLLLTTSVSKAVLRPFFGQLLEQVSWLLERVIGKSMDPTQRQPAGRLECEWLDSDAQDLQGGGLDRLLATHVAAGRQILEHQPVLGFATDKASVKTRNLQASVIFTPGSFAVVACPQAPQGRNGPF